MRRTRAWGLAVVVAVVACSIAVATVAAANDGPARAAVNDGAAASSTTAPPTTQASTTTSTSTTATTSTTTTTLPTTPASVTIASRPEPPALVAVRNTIDVAALDGKPSRCPDGSGANPCFGIQQNLTIRPGKLFVQNVYMIRKRQSAYEAMGGYWVWDFARSCGSTHTDCLVARHKTPFRPITLPARLELHTAVVGNELHFANTMGALPAFALPGRGGHVIGYDAGAGAARMNPDVVVVGMAQGDIIDFVGTAGRVTIQLRTAGATRDEAPRTYCLLPDTRKTHTLEDARGLHWGVVDAASGAIAFDTAPFGGSVPGAGVKVTPIEQSC